MGYRLAIVIVVFMIANSTAFSQNSDWLVKMNKIHLLTDKYDEVIKVLGDPVGGSKEKKLSAYFNLPEGRIFVGFASGLCVVTPYSDGKPIGWNVPEWTVIEMSFTPNKPLSRKMIPFDLTTFRKSPFRDSPGAYMLANRELGIDLSMNSKGKITLVGFSPTQKLESMHCN